MLDLDSLVEQKARRLNETEQPWREAVWSAEFQRCSGHMSDGEVEQLLTWCPSAGHLRAFVAFIEKRCQETGLTPFPCLLDLAKQAKLSPEEWLKTKLPLRAP